MTRRSLDGLVAASTKLRIVPVPSLGDDTLANQLPSLLLNLGVSFDETLVLDVIEADDGRYGFRLLARVRADRLRIPHLAPSGSDPGSVARVARVDGVVGEPRNFAGRDALLVHLLGYLAPFVPLFAKTFDLVVFRVVFGQHLHRAARILAHGHGKCPLELRGLAGCHRRVSDAMGSVRVGSCLTAGSSREIIGTIQHGCDVGVAEVWQVSWVGAATVPEVPAITITSVARRSASLGGDRIDWMISGVDGTRRMLYDRSA